MRSHVHTSETIFAKLNSDLTDAERKSYFKILLASPETAHLLTVVALTWKKQLLEKQLEMEVLKEKIRVKNCYIEVHKENPTFGSEENIEAMQHSIDEDTLTLTNVQSDYEKSAARAEKSLLLFEPVLEEAKHSIANETDNNTDYDAWKYGL